MATVTNQALIRGNVDRVFDLVTTARYWVQWHPATVAVSGQVIEPMRLGDVIRERARIGGMEAEGEWTVTALERPKHVVLQMPGTRLGDLRITYAFRPMGDQVEFTRALEYDPSGLPTDLQARIERQMSEDSQVAVERIAELAASVGASDTGLLY